MSQTLERTYSARELAPLIGWRDAKPVYRAVERGTIHAVRIGRTVRIPYAEVARLTGNDPLGW